LQSIVADLEACLDRDDWYSELIALGAKLPPMDPALKTDSTRVPGCSANVWVYPLRQEQALRFAADSDAAIVKGVAALVVAMADGKTPEDVLATDFEGQVEQLGLRNMLSSNRTQGIPNMIARIREAAARLVA
jgi:cysteine desulfuration protein SufE